MIPSTATPPVMDTNYLADGFLAPELRLAIARAWLAAGGAMTQVRRVTVLRPVISARVPGHDVAIPE